VSFITRSRVLAAALLLALATLCAAKPQARAAAPRTIGVADVKPGMKGYGLTVFSGTAPERFDVEVVAVVPNFLLKQSIILVRCSHPIVDKAGIIGGMSGSPIYLDGRLAGALALGWHFQKEPIAGVTPIANMLEVLDRPWRGAPSRTPFSLAAAAEPFERGARQARIGAETLQERLARSDDGSAFSATPLALSGFAGAARGMLDEVLAPFGIEPLEGGGSSSDAASDPGAFEAGSALGIQLIRGDMSATGIGTVTYVDGDDLLAFGHPMFNMGEGALPISTARIHTVIAALNRSNKLGSPIAEHGALRQDRQAAISAKVGARAPMIPMRVKVRDDRGGRELSYAVEIASHALLTPRLVHAALVNIVQNAASDAVGVTAEIEGRMRLAGRDGTIALRDAGTSKQGLAPLASYFRPAGMIDAVLDNPFEDVRIESLEFDVRLRYGLDISRVVGVEVTAEAPAPGETITVRARLRSYGGEEQVVPFSIRVPDVPEGTAVTFEIGGGDAIVPPMAEPERLEDIIANVERFFSPESIVVSTSVPRESLALRGRLLEMLPDSAAAALKPAVGSEPLQSYRAISFEAHPASHVVAGKEAITITVGPRRNR
jgi:hypothetical protein